MTGTALPTRRYHQRRTANGGPAIIKEVLRTQGAKIIRHSMFEQIHDIIGSTFPLQAVKLVRSSVSDEVHGIFKGLVGSIFPPTLRKWVQNGMFGTASTWVRKGEVVQIWRRNVVPGAPGEVFMVAGAPALLSPSDSSGDYDDMPFSSPRGRR